MNTKPEPKESRDNLETDLEARAAKSRRHARKNDLYAVACYALAVLGSFFATLLAAFSDLPRAAVAAATAIPGTALLINSVFSFEKKAQWHRRRKSK
jgi:preprotein translocase subunit SecY